MQMSFALPARGAQPDLFALYSTAMLSFWALYSLFDMASAMAPALNARPIAAATALMRCLFMAFPLVDCCAVAIVRLGKDSFCALARTPPSQPPGERVDGWGADSSFTASIWITSRTSSPMNVA